MFSPQSQSSLKESQRALLEKVEELTEQLKQERHRTLTLEGQLTTTNLSLHSLEKVRRPSPHADMRTKRQRYR